MKIKAENIMDVSPEQIAEAMVNATPEEFAAIWREFHNALDNLDSGQESKLYHFAEEINKDSQSYLILHRLRDWVTYHAYLSHAARLKG